jgi:hypothetical protein
MCIRYSNSYFGGSGEIGTADRQQVEETIREARLERLSRVLPGVRSARSELSVAPTQAKLKTYVSIGQPEPRIRIARGVYLLSFGFLTEVPGKFIIAADNWISSIAFIKGERTLVNIPIPRLTNFSLEIIPEPNSLTVPEAGYVAVSKHIVAFTAESTADRVVFTLASQRLIAGDRAYNAKVGAECPEEIVSADDLCLCCLADQATVSVAQCEHRSFCEKCMTEKAIRLHHCPFCSAIA